MARTKLLLVPILLVGGCSPSPLYVDRAQIGTYGEVPRDSRGEPLWSEIGPPPAPPVAEPMPPVPPPA